MRRSPQGRSSAGVIAVEDEGRILEVLELLAVGVELNVGLPWRVGVALGAQVELEVVAVGTDDGPRRCSDSSELAQWKAGSRTISSAGSHCDL